MAQDANLLVWIDMEMTGLQPETDRIIEVALVVTDAALATVAEAPVLVVHQDDATLAIEDTLIGYDGDDSQLDMDIRNEDDLLNTDRGVDDND